MEEILVSKGVKEKIKDISVSKKQRNLYTVIFGIGGVFVALAVNAIIYIPLSVIGIFFSLGSSRDSDIVSLVAIFIFSIVTLVVIILSVKFGRSYGIKKDIENIPLSRKDIISSIFIILIFIAFVCVLINSYFPNLINFSLGL